MPKIITPQQRQSECLAHLDRVIAQAEGLKAAIQAGDRATVADGAKVGEAAYCYIRRSADKLPEAAQAEAPSAIQRVVIVGPNLPSSLQRLGQHHVHAEGCADLKRGAIRPYAETEAYVAEARSMTEIGEDLYADFLAEGSMQPDEVLMDLHFAPCVTLPVQ